MRIVLMGFLCLVSLLMGQALAENPPVLAGASEVVVVDGAGRQVAAVLDYTYPEDSGYVRIAVIVRQELPFILGITRFGFTSTSNMHAVYASDDCTGSPYVLASLFDTIDAHHMLETHPNTIAPFNVAQNASNETLWRSPSSEPPIQRMIQSSWNTNPRDGAGNILPPQCIVAIQDMVTVKELRRHVNLSRFFRPPYSLRMQ